MRKERLLCPGPTPVPPRVALAMARPVMYHRAPAFQDLIRTIRDGLQFLFQTTGDVFFLASSGTGAMEAAVANTCARGDRALVVQGGKFGERWAHLCAAYGVEPVIYEVEWGRAADPDEVKRLLDRDPEIRAVFVQASETSTGVAHPIRPLAALTGERPETQLVVDGITAVGVLDLPFDDWGIDMLVAGSQKALMLPPGLAMGAVSPKAREAFARSDLPKFYFDLSRELEQQAQGNTAYTPAVSLLYGLAESLALLREEGLQACLARHRRLAEATRAGVTAMGLRLFAPDAPSSAVTAVCAPDGVDGQAVVQKLRDEHGITIAGGQARLKGRIFRIAHMGYVDLDDILAVISAGGSVLKALGADVDVGAGLSAAHDAFEASGRS